MSSADTILVCGVNWLGDAVMSMPALQAFRRLRPRTRVIMLVRPALAPLWSVHGAVDELVPLGPGLAGVRRAAAAVRARSCDTAFIFPNSFRSAFVPWLAGVPRRVGQRGHWRSGLLTGTAAAPCAGDHVHQQWEYVRILGLPEADRIALDPPVLRLDTAAAEAILRREGLAGDTPLFGLVPGAARGGSKQWPATHFAAVGCRLLAARGGRVLVFGTAAEAALCAGVAAQIGPAALGLAGRTSLPELAALFGRCAAVVTNDSGGMHLAAAAGTAVVAVFGLTDPEKTGPLGGRCRVVRPDGVRGSRDIRRESAEAAACLAAIAPERVVAAVNELLDAAPGSPP